jgi:hypothetical protein
MTPDPDSGLIWLLLAGLRTALAFIRGRHRPETPSQAQGKANSPAQPAQRPRSRFEVTASLRIVRY